VEFEIYGVFDFKYHKIYENIFEIVLKNISLVLKNI